MRVVVDKKNPLVAEAFRQFGEVRECATRDITRETVQDADIIIIRSETKVTKELLDGTSVKFVGTATIGTDHVDLEYLQSHGIGFASAPGSNANSVAEYIVSAILTLTCRKGLRLSDLTLGVVGVGNVGSKVVRNARALGMKVLQNDPPLARTTGDSGFLPLERLLDADILTLHVPLTKKGTDPTYHLIGREFLSKLKSTAVVINTSRGPVVDGAALKEALGERRLGGAVLDVWEGEPVIDAELLAKVDIGTPHIAGYSYDGKLAAVRMTYEAACGHFGQKKSWTPGSSQPAPAVGRISLRREERSTEETLKSVVTRCYDILRDDAGLRPLIQTPAEERRTFFARLRSEYGIRREFHNTVVELPIAMEVLGDQLRVIGFQIAWKDGE